MSEQSKGSGAPNEKSGANSSQETQTTTQATSEKTVSLDDHKRLLDDAMKMKTQLKELSHKLSEKEDLEKKASEKKLLEAGEFQKIIQIKEHEITTLRTELNTVKQTEDSLRRNLFDAAKLNAVRERLPGALRNPAYLSFIDVEKVAINPETNQIDQSSVVAVVEDFVKEHPHLLDLNNSRQLPNGTPKATSKLTMEEWSKLSAKEKREKMQYVEGFKAFRK